MAAVVVTETVVVVNWCFMPSQPVRIQETVDNYYSSGAV